MTKKSSNLKRRYSPKIILGIDSSFDTVTQAAVEYRERHVYPHFEQQGYTVEKLQGPLARRTHVANKAQRDDVVLLTGVGHGSHTAYYGHYYAPIFETGQYETEESRGKIVHFLACKAGSDLARDFVRHQCRAYFGYDDDFVVVMDQRDQFFECDSEIDRALADGKSASAVYERTRRKFESTVKQLWAEGKYYAAAALETDFDRLRCPSSGGCEWGDKSAKL